ncbi:putative aminophospholipid-translocase [Dispira simplex]|nr:putative aminophospholipid-translocase [Dispira simplex]
MSPSPNSGHRQRVPFLNTDPDSSFPSPSSETPLNTLTTSTEEPIPLRTLDFRRTKSKCSDSDNHDFYPVLSSTEGLSMSAQPEGSYANRNTSHDRNDRLVEAHVDIPDPIDIPPDRTVGIQTRVVVFGRTPPSKKPKFPVNSIRNNKYNLLTFFPLVLYEQFKFFFNLYFLLVALSQLVPALRIGYLFTYVGPLIFVLGVTIGKEAYDDWIRRKRDSEANSQRYEVLRSDGTQQRIPSSKIKVGHLILIHKDDRVPADCILLKTSEISGSCFIRTDQLDGETDWKLRVAVPSCQKLPDYASLVALCGEAEVDAPHKDIYSLVGTLRLTDPDHQVFSVAQVESLSVENTLWANTVVASGTAVGLVIYTGKDTRAVMNTNVPKTKVGLLDLEVNRLSKILFLFTLVLSVAMVALNGFQGLFYIYIFRFLILFSSIIPISLRVNLDMGKTFYAMQITKDRRIPGTVVRTSTIPEELGRLEYLLSDKTGTLTQNDMELKKLHMGTMSYTTDTMDEITNSLATYFSGIRSRMEYARHSGLSPATTSGPLLPDVETHPVEKSDRSRALTSEFTGRRDISARVGDIVQALALCHNVTPTTDDDEGITYQASSPDEVAIVEWTESVGLALVHRDRQTIRLLVTAGNKQSSNTANPPRHSGELSSPHEAHPSSSRTDTSFPLEFEVLHIFPFTSESKRMGIIVREKATGEITFYQKGADTVMTKRIQYNDWLEEECGNMAREGLRTLVIAKKRLSEQSYLRFDSRYREASTSLVGRQTKLDQAVGEFLEHDLELLGLTGVEDKLQEDVKNTLELMRNAGLKIWMLTGDKVETATCIAVSSKLVSRNQSIHTVAKLTSPVQLQDEFETLQMIPDCCLVIDGQSLQVALAHWRDEFMQVAMGLPAVVCCRCSPTQKADITKLIKQTSGKRVCAIGDGGNDVSMILAADVGVGIEGKEGKQASLAADFSITQFSHITRLLLWHGRNSYKRSAKLSQFVIHRGLIISVMQAVFSAMFYYAPIALYQGALMVGYTTVYTMAPVFSLVLDQDISDDTAMLYPELYKELTKGRSLSYKTFFWWLLISVYQAGAIMMLAIWLFDTEFLHIVSISFTALIFNELLMVAFEIKTWHPYMIYSEVGSLLIYLLSIYFLKSDFDLAFMLTWAFVWKLGIIILVSSFSLYVVKLIKRVYAPPSYTKLA